MAEIQGRMSDFEVFIREFSLSSLLFWLAYPVPLGHLREDIFNTKNILMTSLSSVSVDDAKCDFHIDKNTYNEKFSSFLKKYRRSKGKIEIPSEFIRGGKR